MGEKIIVTQEILDMNPDLVEQGVEIGEEIEMGEPCNEDGSPLSGNETAFDGPGGTDPNKPRPPKPPVA